MARIIVLSPFPPFPLASGDRKRLGGILRSLRPHHELVLLSPGVTPDVREQTRLASQELLGPDGSWIPVAEPDDGPGRVSALLDSALASQLRRSSVDLVIAVGQIVAAALTFEVPAPVLVELCIIPSVLLERGAVTCGGLRFRARHNFKALARKEQEVVAGLLARHPFLVCSEEDREHLLRTRAGSVYVVENFASGDLSHKRLPFEERRDGPLLMTGPFDSLSNCDGLHWFSRHVAPLLGGKIGDRRVVAVGRGVAGRYRRTALDAGVQLSGWVDDLGTALARCSVFLTPLRIGSGTKTRILDAGLLGLPVVTTTVGAEGLHLVDGEHAIIADRPRDHARGIIDVVSDPELARRLGDNLRRLVEERFLEETVMAAMPGVVKTVLEEARTYSSSGSRSRP